MKRGRVLGLIVLAGVSALAGGCASGQGSASARSANREATVSPAPARQRGLMFASDNLGRSVFADGTSKMASAPDRD